MTALPEKKLTVEEYFVLECADPWKNEFYDGEMIPMIQTGWRHNTIIPRLIYGFGEWLNDGPYCSLSSRMRVFFPKTGLYTYPDILILPRPVECTDSTQETILNPHILVEVITADSELRVRRTMHRHYMRAPSVKEIVLVADDEPRIERYVRSNSGEWTFALFSDLSQTLSLNTIRAELPLVDIYADIDLPSVPVYVEPLR